LVSRPEACLAVCRNAEEDKGNPAKHGPDACLPVDKVFQQPVKESENRPVPSSSTRYLGNPFEELPALISVPSDHGWPYIWKLPNSIELQALRLL